MRPVANTAAPTPAIAKAAVGVQIPSSGGHSIAAPVTESDSTVAVVGFTAVAFESSARTDRTASICTTTTPHTTLATICAG